MKKKVLSILLVICMVVGMLPATVFAAGESIDEGICPHHPEHTPECGYAPATDGSASCTHVHDGNCGYTVITPGFPCNHYHDWFDCYIDNCSHACDCNGAPSCPNYPMCDGFKHDETCDPGNEIWGDYACGHDAECGIATGCKQLNCSHKHGEDCTYVAEVGEGCTHVHDESCSSAGTAGSPCTYDCVLCDQDEPAAGKFHVTYDANGGEGTTEDVNEYAADATVTVLANSFTREGYTFTGWNTAADGSGTAYAPEATLTLSADLTLYAQWEEEEAEKFTVTYDANGGEGTTVDANEYAAGATVTILDSSFTLEGHTFTGWNTAADGSGTAYAAGDEVVISADLTLYAQWEAEGHSHCVCGKTHRPIGSHSAESVQTWQPLTITSGDLTSGSYYLEDNVTITDTITISGTVNLCLNGKTLNGNGNATILSVGEGDVLNIADCVGSGTITGANSGGTSGSAIFVIGGNVTMFGGNVTGNSATKYGNIYLNGSAVFTLNGGSVSNNSLTEDSAYGGGGFYVRTATLIMNGGTISGNTTAYGYGGGIYCSSYATVYINGGTISGNTSATKGDGIFYSCLEGNKGVLFIGGAPTIADEIYLDNSGATTKYPYITSAIRNQLNLVVASFSEGRVVAEGSDYTLTETDLTRISLKGADGTTYYCKLVKENNQIIMTATDPGYTAKYLVIYDGNGGTGSIADSNEYAVGDTATVKSNSFTLEDYTFVGWNTKADGTGTSYAPGDEVTISADLILYAQWAKGSYNVTVAAANNGTATVSHVKADAGQRITVTATPNPGYTLDTISVKTVAGVDVNVTNGKFTMPEADVVVTVTFAANATYTITVADTTHGTVVASRVSAAEGAEINLTISPDVGYELDTLSVKTEAGADVTVTNNKFTMPGANVVITVAFKTEYVQPEYTVIIPENIDVKLNDLATVLGKIKVTITNLDPTNLIKVALDSDCELVHEDDDDKTIPYSVKAGNEEFTFATYEQTGETELSIHITQEDWDKAFSGKYTDTINFVISVITKN